MGLPTKEQLQKLRERRKQRTSVPSMPSSQVVSTPSRNVPLSQRIIQSPFGQFLRDPSQRYDVPDAPPDAGDRNALDWLNLVNRGLGVAAGMLPSALPGTGIGPLGRTVEVPWGEEGKQYRIPGVTDVVPMFAAGQQAMQEGARLEEAMSAAQDVVDAPPGYWGASEVAAAALPTGAPFAVGGKLATQAPQIASAVSKIAPQAIRSGTRQAVQTGLESASDLMRLPWMAEELAGKYLLAKPVSWAFGKTIAATGIVTARLNTLFRNSGSRQIDNEAVAGAAQEVARSQPALSAGPGGNEPIALPQYTQDAVFSNYNINIAANERLVTVVTTDAPQGQTWIVRDSAEVNKALADLQASGNVSIVDGVLNERQARDQWDRLYGAGSDVADRVIGPQVDPAGTPGIQPRVLSPEERLMTVQDVPTNVYSPRGEDPAAFQRVTAPVPEAEISEAGQRIASLQDRITQLQNDISEIQGAVGGSAKQKSNRVTRLRNKQKSLNDVRRELQQLTAEADYDPTRPFRVRVPEEQARFPVDEPLPIDDISTARRAATEAVEDQPLPDIPFITSAYSRLDEPLASRMYGRRTATEAAEAADQPFVVDAAGNVSRGADVVMRAADVRTLLGSPARLSFMSNMASRAASLLGRGYRQTTEISGAIQSAFRDRDAVRASMDSLINRAKTIVAANKGSFRMNSAGQILDPKLQNVVRNPDGTVIQSPTIAQVAARLDGYAPFLDEDQTIFMAELRNIMEVGSDRAPGINQMWKEQDASFVRLLAREKKAGLLDDGGFYIDQGKKVGNRFERSGYTIEDLIGKQMEDVRDIITEGYIIGTVKRVGGIKPGRQARGQDIGTRVDDLINDIADESVVDEILRAIKSEVRGSARRNILFISAFNDLYRGLKATADFSFTGIQGLLRFYSVAATAPYQTGRRVLTGQGDIDLVDWGKAVYTSLKVLRQDADALFRFFQDFDEVAVKESMPTVEMFAVLFNVRVGAGATEFAIKGLHRLGVIGRGLDKVAARFNLSFGTAGDIMRLQMARKLVQAEMAVTKAYPQGRTLDDLVRSGKAREIGRTVNMMTGWTDNVAGSGIAGYDLANMAMFAPRFFQARLETIGQGLLGTARGMTRQEQTVMSREAAKAIWSMIGLGTVFTVAVNESLQDTPGKETNYLQPFVNGYWNPNFMTMRIGTGETGRDFNIFGPWMSILRLLVSSGVAAKNLDPGELLSVYRGMTSGSMRILWDNASGYTFMGDPAPFTQKDGARTIADPEHIRNYIVETITPIAAGDVLREGKVIAENIPGALEGEPGAAAGIRAGVAGITGSMLGSNIVELSRTDLKDEHARDKYNTPYNDLSRQAQKIVDFEIIEKHGPASFGGSQGALRKEIFEAQKAHKEVVAATAKENLEGTIGVGSWNPAKARQEWRNSQRDMQRKLDEIYAKLYPGDEEKIPEEGTTEYLVYKYYKMFEENENPDGSLNYESLDEAEHAYWAGLDEAQRREVLDNIRVLEGTYPKEAQDMRMASRYIGNVKLDIGGQRLSYWDLDKHPLVVKDLQNQLPSIAPSKIQQFLGAEYIDRKGLTLGGESTIFKRIEEQHAKQSREKGILHSLRSQFVQQSLHHPTHKYWPVVMILWDYNFLGKDDLEDVVITNSKKLKGQFSAIDYDKLYESTLGSGQPQLVGTQ